MPAEERGSIGNVKPTGWHTVKYDVIADRYLYNRCHLIGYQLAGENANEQNLITGTRYFNVEGMLPWENVVAEYVKETGGHVLYRVTPYFEGDNLVASGVLMEAWRTTAPGSVSTYTAIMCSRGYGSTMRPGKAGWTKRGVRRSPGTRRKGKAMSLTPARSGSTYPPAPASGI